MFDVASGRSAMKFDRCLSARFRSLEGMCTCEDIGAERRLLGDVRPFICDQRGAPFGDAIDEPLDERLHDGG